MSRKMKKIWNWFTTVLVVLVVLLAVLLVGARIVGFKVFTVLSGSMEPDYPVGSLIYVREVDPDDLESKDVITFMLDENIVATHRIIEVIPDEADSTVVYFRTKGDANNAADGKLVHSKNVIGTPVFTIPWLGYVANFIQNPPGTYIAIAVCAILILLMFVPDLLRKEEKNE
ncbi:MAG: signal peptidase I [Lachnospiraceae bacterium]|nr:signal peptidase I [Lachnospiraceae bacterium]